MARTVEQILKQQLGNLLAEIAVLTAQLEERNDEIAKLNEAKSELKESA